MIPDWRVVCLPKFYSTLGQILIAEEAEEFMKEADLNGDGKLDYDEFVKMMMTEEFWTKQSIVSFPKAKNVK